MIYILQISPEETGDDNIRVIQDNHRSLDLLVEQEQSSPEPFPCPELGIQPVESTETPAPRYDPSVQ